MAHYDPSRKSGLLYRRKRKARRRAAGEQPTATVVLSGGAPNSALMAGAMAAIYKHGKTFNVFFTSGAGIMSGLLFISPKTKPASTALISMLNLAIPEPLWSMFPVNYNVFFKNSPWTRLAQAWGNALKIPGPSWQPGEYFKRVYNSTVSFWTAACTPSKLGYYFSKGLCEPTPLTEAIDFSGIENFNGTLLMNAYNITEGRMQQFQAPDISPGEVKAAISYPYIYPPFKLGDSYYFEGSSIDPLNLPVLSNYFELEDVQPTDSVVIIDLLGSYKKALIRLPRNLIDAFGISILTPLVSLSEKEIRRFNRECEEHQHEFDVYTMNFDIPIEQWPFVTDFSYENMSALWTIGYCTGKEFCTKFGQILPDREPEGPNTVSS